MKTSATAILLLLLVTYLSSPQNPEWIRYSSPEGQYAVRLPAEPNLTTQESTSTTGDTFTQYLASVSDGEITYVVAYFDYVPPSTFSLEKARDLMIRAIKGSLLDERAISLGGYPGRDLRLVTTTEAGVEHIVRARFYDVEHRVYIIQFTFAKSAESESVEVRATRYFDSFEVKK